MKEEYSFIKNCLLFRGDKVDKITGVGIYILVILLGLAIFF